MSGYLMITGLVCLQTLRAMSASEYAATNLRNNIWLTDFVDKQQPTSRFERNDQHEVPSDVVMKNGSPYPKIIRRGFAGEEFFLKASKSVPRIGRRNNDVAEPPKRSVINNKDQANAVEYWSYFQPNDISELASKHDLDLQYGCQQLDAKTIFLMDTSNFVCDDKFYCCAPAKRLAVNAPRAANV